MGNCPHRKGSGSPEEQTFEFNVPLGMPKGDALFAWSWLNREHESFFNCAKVHIESNDRNEPRSAQLGETPHAEERPFDEHRVMAKYGRHYKSPHNPPLQSAHKHTDVCIWKSAPTMETSYYTIDATCMPNAKLVRPASDNFEVGWDVSCGVVEGDGEYSIERVNCET
jgi:hypothetical protein